MLSPIVTSLSEDETFQRRRAPEQKLQADKATRELASGAVCSGHLHGGPLCFDPTGSQGRSRGDLIRR